MDKKSLLYSGALLLSLIIVAVLLNRGTVRAILNPADNKLFTDEATPTQLGATRILTSTLAFPSQEEASIFRVQLVIHNSTTQTTTVDVDLPIDPVIVTSTSAAGVTTSLDFASLYGTQTLLVFHQFVGVEDYDPASSTLSGATFPSAFAGATFPGAGYFKGVGTGVPSDFIYYRIDWTPPITAPP